MNIKEILSKAVSEYSKVGDIQIASEHNFYKESEWDGIESVDKRKRHIYYLAQETKNRLPQFIPFKILPYVCDISIGNYADPKYYSYKSEVGKWNENFIYIWIPGALPFVVTKFLRAGDRETLYQDVRYIVPLCVNDMEIWKWQEQEETTWLPKGANDKDTIWKVIGYCVNKRISMESGDNNLECEEVNEDGEE